MIVEGKPWSLTMLSRKREATWGAEQVLEVGMK
jgi:hypothetical protein